MEMKFLQLICRVFFLVSSAYGQCEEGCDQICSTEISNPENFRTFESKTYFEKWNCNNPNDEFIFAYEGKCIHPKNCPHINGAICVIPKIGVCGKPETAEHFCDLEKHNNRHPDAEYEYYHDDDCNELSTVKTVDCDCLECDDRDEPVCAIPQDPCARPFTFKNYCCLQKFNCETLDYQNWYFHEGHCYTDDMANA